jgi:hypothetical protein
MKIIIVVVVSIRRLVVSFTPRPLYPCYPLDRRLAGPQSLSGRCAEEKILLLLGIEPRPSNPLPVGRKHYPSLVCL